MTEKQSKNYQLTLKQIKNVMNQALSQLPEKEQKLVDKNIYYDSRTNGTQNDWEENNKTSNFYMYYNYYSNDGIQWGAVKLFIRMIRGHQTIMAYTYHPEQIESNLASKSVFEGDLPALVDVLPSCSLEKIISQ